MLLRQAWGCAPDDAEMLKLAAVSMREMGRTVDAIALIEEALTRNGSSAALCEVIAKLAFDLDLPDVAETACRLSLAEGAADPKSYARLANAYRKQGKYDEAIALLSETVPMFPESGDLWSALAVATVERDGPDGENVAFMQEALARSPDDYVMLVNYAARHCGAEAEEAYRKAIKIDPKRPDAYAQLGILEIARGAFGTGWRNYDRRLDPGCAMTPPMRYAVSARTWTGQPLADKTLLVMAEQGIGDEVLFAAAVPRLAEEAGQLCIGCDPRLVDIYRRSFPGALVGGFADESVEGVRHRSFPDIDDALAERGGRVDYAVPIGSVPGVLWDDPALLPTFPEGYLKADPARVAEFAAMMGPRDGRLRVGVSWESGKLEGGRKHAYPGLEGMKPLLMSPGVEFFSLQYNLGADEVAEANAVHGVALRAFDGVDLKADIEANLAAMANLDVVIGPPVATQMLAKAAGAEVWEISGGPPWTYFGRADGTVPMFPRARAFFRGQWGWTGLADDLVVAMRTRIGGAQAPFEAAHGEERKITSIPARWRDELRDLLINCGPHSQIAVPGHYRLNAALGERAPIRVLTAAEPGPGHAADFSVAGALEPLLPILRTPGVDVICACEEERRDEVYAFGRAHGLDLRTLQDVGLVYDASGIAFAALHVDAVIGRCSPTIMTSLAFGRPTWVLDDGLAWDLYGPSEEAETFPLDGIGFSAPRGADTQAIERVAARLRAFAAEPRPKTRFSDRLADAQPAGAIAR